MHKISIPDELVSSVIARRGKRDRYETLAGASTALVVIDLQNVFMLPGMPVEVPVAREIVPNVNRLATAVRGAGGKVVWVKMTSNDLHGGWSVFFDGMKPEVRAEISRNLERGSHGHALHAELDVEMTDLVVEKTRYSAFIQGSSNLDGLLRSMAIDTVIVVGTLTNVCCESTTRDGMMLNYRTVFVSDANAALTDEDHNATLRNMFRTFADVYSTDEAIARLDPRAAVRAATG
ncbi:MAG: isochorismatase hydrolase [Rhodospirillales bacterium]|nr:isochorismatase hydrolase [Rhodospirillales bacterium]